ncbi:MAG: hypothetical protein M0R03_23600 [Novosphingobium sp.]|nr:hypothetical protein [Novosphingobium sp.]
MDIFPKFIIETDEELGDCLIISKCTYHRELVTNKNMVKGGGWYRVNTENKSITFGGESHDFGAAKIEDIKNCINNGNIYTNKYLTHSIAKDFKFLYDIGSEIISLK